MFLFRAALTLTLFSFTFTFAEVKHKEEVVMPWLTGPLLTPSAHVIPNHHANIEPYLYVTDNCGTYTPHWKTKSAPHNVYNVITQVFTQIGLPAHFDLFFTPQWEWNHTHHASHWALNDMSFGFDYQFYARHHLNDPWPTVKLSVKANAPIGKYDKLNPRLRGTDGGGTGNWLPSAGLVFSRLTHISGPVFFAPRLNIQYTVPTPVFVKGLNVYGGGHGTRGTVFPGQSLTVLFGFEIPFTQNWALAGDIQYLHQNKTRFKGRRGSTDGVPNEIGAPSSESFSIAPAIEYNWSAYYGVIAGAWFTVGGRNTQEFISGVVAINIYH